MALDQPKPRSFAFARAMAGIVRLDSGRLLDEMLGGGASFPAVRGGGFSPLRPMLVDVAEKPDCFEMLVDIPGVPKEHISLVVEGQTVTISATPTAEEAAKEAGDSGKDVTWHRIDRSTMYASRALRFPENANMHDIQAHADDGVLRLRIAKTAEEKRDKTVVKVT